jgi:hypothetical protein
MMARPKAVWALPCGWLNRAEAVRRDAAQKVPETSPALSCLIAVEAYHLDRPFSYLADALAPDKVTIQKADETGLEYGPRM